MAELLTLLAIIALLAGVLFPVFLSAKSAARRTTCSSNLKQVHDATFLYTSDYDDYFVPVNHRPGEAPNSRKDRTWVQLILPYARSFTMFNCPGDFSKRDKAEATFDQDLVPGDVYSQYYTASMRVNVGYNFLNLAPIVWRAGRWMSNPRPDSSVENHSKTLLFVDTVWSRAPDGTPTGGGNWLVVPPCRYEGTRGSRVDTFSDPVIYSPYFGWDLSDSKSPAMYGNAWPWHSGRVNTVRLDGSVKSVSIGELISGCNLQNNWNGNIRDRSDYLWDLR